MNFNTAKMDRFLAANPDCIEFVEYNDPRAVGIRAEADRLNKRSAARRAAKISKDEAAAAKLVIGQTVQHAYNCFSTIIAINGGNITIDTGAMKRTIRATMLFA